MKIALYGGRCDGETIDLGEHATEGPPNITRMPLSAKELAALPEGTSVVPTVEYLRTQRTRSDGCVLYVLKGARL